MKYSIVVAFRDADEGYIVTVPELAAARRSGIQKRMRSRK